MSDESQAEAMFLGTYLPRTDDKGRVILPAKFGTGLMDGVVVTRGQEHCLYVFPRATFERMYAQLQSQSVTGHAARSLQRLFLAGAHDETPDAQRRILLPPALRTYAGINRDVAIIGVGTRLEIWDASTWSTYLAAEESGYAAAEDPPLPGMP